MRTPSQQKYIQQLLLQLNRELPNEVQGVGANIPEFSGKTLKALFRGKAPVASTAISEGRGRRNVVERREEKSREEEEEKAIGAGAPPATDAVEDEAGGVEEGSEQDFEENSKEEECIEVSRPEAGKDGEAIDEVDIDDNAEGINDADQLFDKMPHMSPTV
ncbi:hypothetical protein U1Q18_010062 [Sarracenia purpurea var. burkii]